MNPNPIDRLQYAEMTVTDYQILFNNSKNQRIQFLKIISTPPVKIYAAFAITSYENQNEAVAQTDQSTKMVHK